jgi:hypothetical protein
MARGEEEDGGCGPLDEETVRRKISLARCLPRAFFRFAAFAFLLEVIGAGSVLLISD